MNEIRSARHALSMQGEREIRRWISLVATLGAAQHKPDELVQSALVRGHFCEVIAQRSPRRADCFPVGLLSLMDAIRGVPMPELLERVPVGREIKAALLGLPGLWLELHISEKEISDAYLDSVRWALEVSRA